MPMNSQSDVSSTDSNDPPCLDFEGGVIPFNEICLLPGEKVQCQVTNVTYTDILDDKYLGILWLTNFRIIFFTEPEQVSACLLSPESARSLAALRPQNSAIIKGKSKFYEQVNDNGNHGANGVANEQSAGFLTRCVSISKIFVAIPIFSIKSVISSRQAQSAFGVQIVSKDFKKMEIMVRTDLSALRYLIDCLNTTMASGDAQQICFSYTLVNALPHLTAAAIRESWLNIYDMKDEFRRQNIESNGWKLVDANKEYRLCSTYPDRIAVPRNVTIEELRSCAEFRSSDRLPVLSWLHPESRAALCRASQPLSGIIGSRSTADENYIRIIRQANANENVLYIFDARPQVNAQANRTRGGGIENISYYEGTRYVYLKIENINAMRSSWNRLEALCTAQSQYIAGSIAGTTQQGLEDAPSLSQGSGGGGTAAHQGPGGVSGVPITGSGGNAGNNTSALLPSGGDIKWYDMLSKTNWLLHIRRILYAAVCVVEKIENKTSVLVHCSDGWDRTPQITSLAMLLLDPYYRTLRGFQVLIEKEWCSMGHQFPVRLGMPWAVLGGHAAQSGGSHDLANQISPVFQQFLDCVWQVTQQFQHAFQFNERLLIDLMENLTSARFGNFLYCCEAQRQENNVYAKTFSFWSYVNSNELRYKNPFYIPEDVSGHRVLIPQYATPYLKLWTSFYLRQNPLIKPTDLPVQNATVLMQQRMKFLELMRSSRKDTTLTHVMT